MDEQSPRNRESNHVPRIAKFSTTILINSEEDGPGATVDEWDAAGGGQGTGGPGRSSGCIPSGLASTGDRTILCVEADGSAMVAAGARTSHEEVRRSSLGKEAETPGRARTSSSSSFETSGGVNWCFSHSTFRREDLKAAEQAAEALEADAYSPQYIRALENELRAYVAWCADQKVEAIPADIAVVLLYLTHLVKDRKRRHLDVAIAAIGLGHARANLPRPTRAATGYERQHDVRELVRGHINSLGSQGGRDA